VMGMAATNGLDKLPPDHCDAQTLLPLRFTQKGTLA
jgi:hypothetical protein